MDGSDGQAASIGHAGAMGNSGGGVGGGGGVPSVTTRLESLERKIDMLIANQAGASMSRAASASGSLHDLANIATDPLRFASTDSAERSRSRGMLSVHADGRSSYVGPHAHSVYLAREGLEQPSGGSHSPTKPPASRPGSPTPIDLESAAPVSTMHPSDDGVSPHDSMTPSYAEIQNQLTPWTTPGFRSPHSTVAIWNQLRPFLPQRDVAVRLVNVYYASIIFMHDFVPRHEFDQEIWPIFYSDLGTVERSSTPPPGFHPHKMSLVFAVLALGVLLDVKRPQRDPVGRAFYSCSWNALALSNFTESTSADTLLALVHAALYLTWRRLSKYAESAWPLFGTMMSMMTRSGLHRDPAHFELSDGERERRRRIFWDVQGVEVLRALAFCRPPSILDRHVDTRRPSTWIVLPGQQQPESMDERSGAFHALKSYHAQLVNRILDECLCTTSTYQLTMEFDTRILRLMRMIPTWMSPTILPLAKRSIDGVGDMEATYTHEEARNAMIEEMRRHLIHLNCHQLRLLLHRGWFSEALQQIGIDSEPNQNSPPAGKKPAPERPVRFQESVDAVNVCASSIIEIITSAWAHYPALVVRWMFFWNGLFSAAVCRGLYAVKRRRGGGALAAWRDLRAAIQLLRHAVDGWKPLEQPLGILLRLHRRAEMALGGTGRLQGPSVSRPTEEPTREGDSVGKKDDRGEDLELLGGDEERRVRFAKRPADQGLPSTAMSPDLDMPSGEAKKARLEEQSSSGAKAYTAPDTHGGAATAFTTDILGQPAPDSYSYVGAGETPASSGAARTSNVAVSTTPGASTPVFDFSLFSPSAMRMPASLPAFALGGEDVHMLSSNSSGSAVSGRGAGRDGTFSGPEDFSSITAATPQDMSASGSSAPHNGHSAGTVSSHLSLYPPSSGGVVSMAQSGSEGMSTGGLSSNSAPSTAAPLLSTATNTSQLMQMLSSDVGWDDVATWDNVIFDL